MEASTANRSATVAFFVFMVPGVIVLPFMVALLSSAWADAVYGDKEPMIQTMLGLLAGILLAAVFAIGVPKIRRMGWKRTAMTLLVSMIAFDGLAIPVARWMIATAYASPTNRIVLW